MGDREWKEVLALQTPKKAAMNMCCEGGRGWNIPRGDANLQTVTTFGSKYNLKFTKYLKL